MTDVKLSDVSFLNSETQHKCEFYHYNYDDENKNKE